MTEPTLEELARWAVAGDRDAMATLVRELEGPIHALAQRMLWHPQDAEDATQEILVRAVTRLAQFESLDDVETAMNQLMARESPQLVTRLERRPGQKEARYAHLLAGEVTYDPAEAAVGRTEGDRPVDRIDELEAGVEELRREVADLRAQLDAFRKQFE